MRSANRLRSGWGLGAERWRVGHSLGGTPAVTGQGGLEVARANLWHGRAEEAHGAGRRLQLPPTTSWPPISSFSTPGFATGRAAQQAPPSGNRTRDVAKCGEMRGDVARCGEIPALRLAYSRYGEIWGAMWGENPHLVRLGDMGRYGELWGDMGRSASSPTSPSLGPRSVRSQA